MTFAPDTQEAAGICNSFGLSFKDFIAKFLVSLVFVVFVCCLLDVDSSGLVSLPHKDLSSDDLSLKISKRCMRFCLCENVLDLS